MSRAGVIRLLVVCLALLALEVACRTGAIDRHSLVSPSAMIMSAAQILSSGEYTADILTTLLTVAIASIISIAFGFALGIALFAFPRFKHAVDPFLASYYAVPSFIFYPLFIVMFGLNRWPLVAVAFIFAFVAMAIATVDGFLSVRPIFYRAALSMRLSKTETLRKIMLPAASPYIFTGAKLAISYAFIGVVAGEFVQSGSGLGFRIAFAYQSFETQTMYGLILVLLVCVVTINAVLWSSERRLYRRLGR